MISLRTVGRRRGRSGALLTVRFIWAILALTVAGVVAQVGMPANASAQATRAVVWDQYDVSLTLRPDGSYRVVERMVVDFQGGPFTFGNAAIQREHLEGINNVGLTEATPDGDVVYEPVDWDDFERERRTYTATLTNTEIRIEWGFEPTTSEERIFLLSYDVYGALRVYPNNDPPNQQIWWTAIGSDVTEIAPVRESTVTVTLPLAVPLDQVRIGESGEDDPADYTADGQIFTWQRTNLEDGDSFELRVQFPMILNAAPPPWQQEDDERRREDEEDEERGAILNLMFLGIGLASAVLGGVGVYGLWYTRGRDPQIGPVADFLPKPPDDLPPGAAGALVDEVAHERDVVATLVDLGHRGVVKIDEVVEEGILGFGGGRDFNLRLEKDDAPLAPFELALLGALFGSTLKAGEEVKLSSAKSRFTQSQETIKNHLYEELVKRGYFPTSPEKTRSTFKNVGVAALVILGIGGWTVISAVADIAPLVWLVFVVFIVLAIALVLTAKAMPRKSLAGAESAAKWRAFRRYLEDIDRYEKLDEAKGIFDKYLPYAIAFDLEQSWVRKFANIGAEAPSWYGGPGGWAGDAYPRRYPRRRGPVIIDGGYGPGWGRSGGGSGGGGDIDLPGMPDLQDASDSAGRSLQSASQGLFDMLNTASRTFSGFSGGSRGGGGWGGSRGFGGGGSRGGSSGGGSRGFG
ncbi:MAG: DUF2207 domain-containing protein [Thermomicrobiales bacterium]